MTGSPNSDQLTAIPWSETEQPTAVGQHPWVRMISTMLIANAPVVMLNSTELTANT